MQNKAKNKIIKEYFSNVEFKWYQKLFLKYIAGSKYYVFICRLKR